ncbi:hypothetical protein Hanom_Chr13g01243141 [Helianthus anomalus]
MILKKGIKLRGGLKGDDGEGYTWEARRATSAMCCFSHVRKKERKVFNGVSLSHPHFNLHIPSSLYTHHPPP